MMAGYLIKYSFEFKELDKVVKDGEDNDHEDVDKAVQHTALKVGNINNMEAIK